MTTVIPVQYKPYAFSEAEAKEIIQSCYDAGYSGQLSYSHLSYAPKLWSIMINIVSTANAK
jgi:hypothetical protein